MKKQHALILTAARELGIEVIDLSKTNGCDTARLVKGERAELFVSGTPVSLINLHSKTYCDNKQLTKVAFEALQIPAPSSILFQQADDPNIANFLQAGKNYVCKPIDGTNGIGVRLNIQTAKEVKNYWKKFHGLATTFMLEEQVVGTDLRVQVIGGQIVAACTRVPAFVCGDGQQTIAQLAIRLQERTKRQNPANDLKMDEDTMALLKEQGVSLFDVPTEGQEIQLKKVANMSQGAIALDLTDELHPVYQEWIVHLTNYIGTSYFAIDFMTKDHRLPPNHNAWAIEINACPEWLHHTFSDRKQHNIPEILLKKLFA